MRVFLAHASEDREWAREFASNLRRRGFEIWDAATEIPRGENWHLEIGKALEDAQAMVVLVSPAAAGSEELAHEVEYALTAERLRNRLIPVIVKPTKKLPRILGRLNPETGDPAEVSERVFERLKTCATLEKPHTARELLKALRDSGLIGMWKDRTDIGDSIEFAQRLRRVAEKRGSGS